MQHLTDEQLETAVREAYECHMLLETSGAAYSTAAGAGQAAAARRRYYELATEQDRRRAMQPVHYLTGKRFEGRK